MSASKFSLAQQQRNFFDTFGYLRLPGLLADRIDDISEMFDRLYTVHRDDVIDWRHDAHYMKSRRVLMQFIERDVQSAGLLDDPRIEGVFRELLGDDFLYRTSDGNIFTGDTYWHSDLYAADFRYRHIKLGLYLDPLDGDSGALRAIPGSHLFGDEYANSLERHIWQHQENLGLAESEVPCVVLDMRPGDGVVFDYRLKHATCNSGAHRRMIAIAASQCFADEHLPDLGKLVRELKEMTGCVYREPLLRDAQAARMKHLEPCLRSERL